MTPTATGHPLSLRSLSLADRQCGPAVRACALSLRGLDLGSGTAGMKSMDRSHLCTNGICREKAVRAGRTEEASRQEQSMARGPPVSPRHPGVVIQWCPWSPMAHARCIPHGVPRREATPPSTDTKRPHTGPPGVVSLILVGTRGRDDSLPRMRPLPGPRGPQTKE